jgi:hypothetical protein
MATPTATYTPTATSELTATEPSVTTEPTVTLEPTATATPTETTEPTAPATPTATPEPTATNEPTATVEPTVTLEPTDTPTETTEPTATATPTATTAPTTIPVPFATPIPVDPASLQLTTTFNFKVRTTGLYQVTYEMLRDAGLDLVGVPADKVVLINDNRMMPIHVYTPDPSGSFGPGSFIEFFGEALDTRYTDTNIYTVQVSNGPVPLVPVIDAEPGLDLSPAAAYTETVKVNNQRAYVTYAPGNDAWYDTRLLVYKTPQTWSFTFQVNGLSSPAAPASLDLVVWGGADWPQAPDHHLQVSVNGVILADQLFDGLVEKTLKLDLPAATLQVVKIFCS